jgi:S1-C subfamily serine protease
MSNSIALIIKFILITIAIETSAFAQLPVSQIVKDYAKSVVTIVALDENEHPLSLGSGFFINASGRIATNHHVLEGSAKAIVKVTNGEKGSIVEITQDDPNLDLLIAETSLKNTKPLTLGDSDTIAVGEDIVAIGNPAGLEGTVSKGIVSGIREVDGVKYIQITAPISPGSSGGPVFGLNGKVVGVATAYLDSGQNLNFAMPVNYLKTLKQSRLKLISLPKMPSKPDQTRKNTESVVVFDIHYEHKDDRLTGIYFSIRNQTNYPIKNIKLFFIYRNLKGEVITYSAEECTTLILPNLAKRWSSFYTFRHFCEGGVCGKVETRVLDYEIDRSGKTSPADFLFKK